MKTYTFEETRKIKFRFARVAFEFGYKAHEQGLSIQQALFAYDAIIERIERGEDVK